MTNIIMTLGSLLLWLHDSSLNNYYDVIRFIIDIVPWTIIMTPWQFFGTNIIMTLGSLLLWFFGWILLWLHDSSLNDYYDVIGLIVDMVHWTIIMTLLQFFGTNIIMTLGSLLLWIFIDIVPWTIIMTPWQFFEQLLWCH